LPAVGAVVVNFNGGDRLSTCIRALRRQQPPFSEILVVDNGSTDASLPQVRASFPDVRIHELGENRGLPAARNAGLRLTTAEVVLLIDHDLYAAEDCLRRLLETYRRERAPVICPRILLWPEGDIVQADGASAHFVGTLALRHGYLPVSETPAATSAVGACPGGCLLVERAPVLAAGGFDEAYFFYLEDLEFSLRLRARGHRLICEPAAVVHHDRGTGTPGLAFRGAGRYPARRAYLTLRHRLRTILIHYRLRTLAVLLPALALYEVSCLGASVARGWGLEWLRAWAWQVVHARSLWRRRREVQRARRLEDKLLLAGGALPLAPGFLRSPIESAAATTVSSLLDLYWRMARRWIG
jgi:GT2 family glycosyltransferase